MQICRQHIQNSTIIPTLKIEGQLQSAETLHMDDIPVLESPTTHSDLGFKHPQEGMYA